MVSEEAKLHEMLPSIQIKKER